MRTRMYGGVGGEDGRLSPLSRFPTTQKPRSQWPDFSNGSDWRADHPPRTAKLGTYSLIEKLEVYADCRACPHRFDPSGSVSRPSVAEVQSDSFSAPSYQGLR